MWPAQSLNIYRRCPRDEVNVAKLDLLCAAVRREVEGETLVYLRTEAEIQRLAKSVEDCRGTKFADEVGDDAGCVPAGARLAVDVTEPLPEGRRAVAELRRTMQEGEPLLVKMRPMGTSRQPPLVGRLCTRAYARHNPYDAGARRETAAGRDSRPPAPQFTRLVAVGARLSLRAACVTMRGLLICLWDAF